LKIEAERKSWGPEEILPQPRLSMEGPGGRHQRNKPSKTTFVKRANFDQERGDSVTTILSGGGERMAPASTVATLNKVGGV